MERMKLNGTEEKLFNELLGYNKELKEKVTFRVAGGWVRDKLMGLECSDIDIAIDGLSGAQFAKGFRTYLKRKHENVHGYHLIPYNHEKSKHLETACLKFHEYSIDFVCLRTETYADTRIPTVQIGTPKEDAERRDLTINALFYNVNEAEIEDHTGRGLADLRDRVIRTPLAPRTTFLDDPLRILRVLRFVARHDFKVDPEVFCALEDPALVGKIDTAVSRERIGQEVRKIIRGENYRRAIGAMVTYKMVGVVFKGLEVSEAEEKRIAKYMDTHASLLAEEGRPEAPFSREGLRDPMVALYSVLQCGAGGPSANCRIAASSLKWTNEEKKKVEQIDRALHSIGEFFRENKHREADPLEYRTSLIRLVRKAGEPFSVAIIIRYLMGACVPPGSAHEEPLELLALYRDVLAKGLADCWKVAPPVKYEDFRQVIPVPKTEISRVQERAAEIALLYGLGQEKDKEEVLRHLQKEYSAADSDP